MVRRYRDRSSAKSPSKANWLEELDSRVRQLRETSDWSTDADLSLQRCRLFLMVRFPELPRPFADEVLSDELSRGEKQIRNSQHAERILRDLNAGDRAQLAALLLDAIGALDVYTRHSQSSKSLSKLGAERNRRKRMLLRKVSEIRRELAELVEYAKKLDPLLGLEYVHAAKRCLKSLSNLEENSCNDEFYDAVTSEYLALEDPRHLSMVELYCFFRYDCGCTRPDSEVRVAMLATDFLSAPVKFTPKYDGHESEGCAAIRIAISRFGTRTT
jgi:hypothetical protein